MKRRTFIALVGMSVLAAAKPVGAQIEAPRGRNWGTAAEKEFRLGAGMDPD